MTTDDDLKPCPWCGTTPWLDDDPDSCGVTIECDNHKCAVRPSTYADYHPGIDVRSRMIASWNRRTP